MQARLRTCFPLCGLLTACASGPSTAPRHYPALPAAGAAIATTAAFDPDPTLRANAVSCRQREPELDNALDDDCDGRIDVHASEAADAFAVALAYPRSAALSFVLREAKGERPVGAPSCADGSGFCTVRLSARELGDGRTQLVARTSDPTQPAASVVISVQAAGKVSSYIAPPLPPGQTERVLGRIAAP